MRSLTYLIATTLDGFIAGPDRADPTPFWPIAPDYVQHVVENFPETLPGHSRQRLGISTAGREFDTVLEGRRTYEIGLAAGATDAYPHLRHLVFSTTLDEIADPAVELVTEDPVARIRQLKQEEGAGIWLAGGGTLAQSLVDEVDRLVLKVAPMTLGAGVPLWGTGAAAEPRKWRLTDEHVLPSGTRFLHYCR
ncbi:dihydrofolate reductase family protein [Aeromicrobium sp. P5_D10]